MLENTIISLTSYPARINTVHLAVQTLLAQTVKTEKLILWLSQEDFLNKDDDLPKELLALKTKGLTIEWCDDLKSYKKLIPALVKYPQKIIITFDDDLLYNKEAVETLYNCHIKYPGAIIAHTVGRWFFNEEDELDQFPLSMYYDRNSTKLNFYDSLKKPSFFNKITGCGGVLYPPGSLHSDVLDANKCMSFAPTNDDIPFWLQAVRNGTKIAVPEKHFPKIRDIPGTQETSLNYINNLAGNTFPQYVKNVMDAYPEIKEILQSESDNNLEIIDEIVNNSRYPLISIVCFTHNHISFIGPCLDGLINQKIKVPLEIIIIDDASTDGTIDIIREYEKELPEKIKIFYQKKKKKSRYAPIIPIQVFSLIQGKYIAFCEGNDCWTDPYKLKKQFAFMERFSDFSLVSSGFSENNAGIITDKIIRCGSENNFDYYNIDIRGYSHLQISTLFCRKNDLENIIKKHSNFKYWDNIQQCYFLLKDGPGRYFSENFVMHNIIPDSLVKSISDKKMILDRYHVFRELYKKTKDIEISKIYFRHLRLLLENRLYKDKMEKTRLLIEKHTKDTKKIVRAIKKTIMKLRVVFSQ
jgi:glycosyltransferase involved in cell wall biosynthesis